jgi:hypothetical protein|uniref:Ubiquitin-like protease family profile domain-containing protein n=1 Tax=viral metagenome TaxID=1070528 RepID=A0A6C0IML6_9ZZZZ
MKHTNKTSKNTKTNCSPMMKKTRKNTCYDKNSLLLIKKEFNNNRNHTHNQITTNNPNHIIKELKQKIKHCSKEDCWLSEIKDLSLRKKTNDYLFAPKQPSTWKNDPNYWLSNFDILDVLQQYEKAYPNFKFIGPTPIDFDSKPYLLDNSCVWKDLCNIQLKDYIHNKIDKIGIIFNLDKHDQSGSHWVSMFINLKQKFIYYFDSAVNPIPPEIIALKNKLLEQAANLHLKLTYHDNFPIMHQYENSECGMYSLFMIITMLTEKVEKKALKSKKQKINFLTKRIPDNYVFGYRDIYFNK